jgi:hypothetical protein
MAHEFDPVAMGLLSAGMTMMDPNGGLMQGVRAGFEGYQNTLANNQHRQQMNDQQAVRQAFADFGQPDESGNVDPNTVFKRMMASGHPALVQFALANAPKRTVKSTLKVLDEQGVPRHQVLFSDGTPGAMIDAPAAERMAFEDMGGVKAGLNPFTGEVLRQFQKSPTPDAQASLAQSAQQFAQRMAQDQSQFNQNFNLNAAKFGFDREQANRPQLTKDGFLFAPPSAQNPNGVFQETPLSAAPKGSSLDRQRSSDKLMPVLEEADRLLDNSTSSLAGTGLDMVAGAFGHATKGAQAAAQLKALEGAIVMAQPRMEGPQSDKDVALYRQMAGQIGDSTIPVETRRAALKTIYGLHQKYASQANGLPSQKEKTPETQHNGRQSFIAPNGYSSTLNR